MQKLDCYRLNCDKHVYIFYSEDAITIVRRCQFSFILSYSSSRTASRGRYETHFTLMLINGHFTLDVIF